MSEMAEYRKWLEASVAARGMMREHAHRLEALGVERSKILDDTAAFFNYDPQDTDSNVTRVSILLDAKYYIQRDPGHSDAVYIDATAFVVPTSPRIERDGLVMYAETVLGFGTTLYVLNLHNEVARPNDR